MALLTQKAILTTFEEMLEEMPFDKLTVSALVRRCGVSSNTFYYHYQDIYDLLGVWMNTRFDMLKKSVSDSMGWKEEVRVFLKYCQNHPKLIHHLLSSVSRGSLEHYIFTEIDDFFVDYVREKTADRSLSEESVCYIAQFCRYSFIGFFLKFTWEKMQADVDESVDRLEKVFSSFIDSAAARIEEDSF